MTSIPGSGVTTATGAFYDRSLSDMKSLRAQAETLQTQASTGNRLTRSSDDPVAASRLRLMARADALSKIDTATASQASSDLQLADATMSDMADALTRAKELTVQASTGTLSPDQRKAIGSELGSIYDTLFSLANTKDSSGNALFGGQGSSAAYSLDAAGKPSYSGGTGAGPVSLGEGQAVTPSMTGPEFLTFKDADGNQTDLLSMMKGLADALSTTSGDPVAAASKGLTDLDSGLNALTTGQTVVGTRMAWIDLTTDRRTTSQTTRTQLESDIGQVDIADAVTRLQQTMTVLEASQASFAKLASLSLFDQIS
ncbi:flagellar hook-associated protein FlgL [Novosphingobium sp. 9]|uniref:flagellar hook-associated protein FlgL n=1 Tax=Novosphingobium sp. 9 TaxID=2025349 RepID=UPI0021B4D54F|nr:flagellar hook-associated protein FlgL [Novosphingobium sp. 9]